eukprot:TRINITY_DN1662_c3_g1_i1.p1 TRINITY_DN1662_c3_g1~~TRINITY_DN1662_c3_g1_i1.p1  ORF type:complete len:219 (-),score=82.43 TRINITY_DN1662_c3_g1_i1:56-712(-)
MATDGWDDYPSDEEAAAGDAAPSSAALDLQGVALLPRDSERGSAEDASSQAPEDIFNDSWASFSADEPVEQRYERPQQQPRVPAPKPRDSAAPKSQPQQQQQQQWRGAHRGPVDEKVTAYFARRPVAVHVSPLTKVHDGNFCFGCRRMLCRLGGSGSGSGVEVRVGCSGKCSWVDLHDFVERFAVAEQKRYRSMLDAVPAITALGSAPASFLQELEGQ